MHIVLIAFSLLCVGLALFSNTWHAPIFASIAVTLAVLARMAHATVLHDQQMDGLKHLEKAILSTKEPK